MVSAYQPASARTDQLLQRTILSALWDEPAIAAGGGVDQACSPVCDHDRGSLPYAHGIVEHT